MGSDRVSPNTARAERAADPRDVETPSERAERLKQARLSAKLTLNGVVKAASRLTKPHTVALGRSTISEFESGQSIPRPETMRTFLLACDVPEAHLGEWYAARERALAPRVRPDGAIRVRLADPQRLGVHPAITVPGVDPRTSPTYVERDIDRDEHGIRARLRAAVTLGRSEFVLLVSGSSVGKSRCGEVSFGGDCLLAPTTGRARRGRLRVALRPCLRDGPGRLGSWPTPSTSCPTGRPPLSRDLS